MDFGTDRDPSLCVGLLSGLDITRLQCMFPFHIYHGLDAFFDVPETDCRA